MEGTERTEIQDVRKEITCEGNDGCRSYQGVSVPGRKLVCEEGKRCEFVMK